MKIEPCNSFAHIAIANASHLRPTDTLLDSDTTWIHINKAIQCDSTNGNAWMFLCVEAMLRGKYDLMRRSAHKMKETEFLTKAMLAYGRWMMRTLPDNAILITNGDMDTFLLLALQAAEGFRTDVAIAEKQWLGIVQYLTYLRDHYKISLPLTELKINSLVESEDFPQNMLLVADLVLKGWLEQKVNGSLLRPIAIAVTVEEDFYIDFRDYFQYAGPFLIWRPNPVNDSPDMLALRNCLTALNSEDFSGSWISKRDYSPVRVIYTKELARNITLAALAYSEMLIKSKKYETAVEILNWAEAYEKNTELGPVDFERISELKSVISYEEH